MRTRVGVAPLARGLLAGAVVVCAGVLSGCAGPAPEPSASATPRFTASPPPIPTPTPAPAAAVFPTGQATVVAGDLDAPWGLVVRDGYALVGERDTGRILRVGAEGAVAEIGVLGDVAHGGEGGLLGMAVDEESRLYVYSTGGDGNRVQRFALAEDRAVLGSAETVLSGLPSAWNHNGGQVAFGPDGMLYVSVGDAGDPASAQDLAILGGKILRLTPDGGIPDDNPFPGSPVYSFGHRNVQGLAWAEDGRMFASEFGQDSWDELNEIVPGGNYGWPEVEGAEGVPGYIDPVLQWPTSEASPSGLVAIEGSLILANLRGASLRVVPIADPSAEQVHFAGVYGRIRAVTRSEDGSLLALTNNTDGRGSPRPGDDLLLDIELAPAS